MPALVLLAAGATLDLLAAGTDRARCSVVAAVLLALVVVHAATSGRGGCARSTTALLILLIFVALGVLLFASAELVL